MKIDLTQPNPTIDAADLAALFDLEPAEVMRLMREGDITSRFETGVGEDAGSHRLTFWHGSRRVRFTCDATGEVVKTSRVKLEKKP
jgi:hypothetical protein